MPMGILSTVLNKTLQMYEKEIVLCYIFSKVMASKNALAYESARFFNVICQLVAVR